MYFGASSAMLVEVVKSLRTQLTWDLRPRPLVRNERGYVFIDFAVFQCHSYLLTGLQTLSFFIIHQMGGQSSTYLVVADAHSCCDIDERPHTGLQLINSILV
jgi:hypothetical protein